MTEKQNPELSKTKQQKLTSSWSLGWGDQGSRTQDALLSPRSKFLQITQSKLIYEY